MIPKDHYHLRKSKVEKKKSSNEKKEVGQRQHVLSGYDFSSVWQEACACKHKFYLLGSCENTSLRLIRSTMRSANIS